MLEMYNRRVQVCFGLFKKACFEFLSETIISERFVVEFRLIEGTVTVSLLVNEVDLLLVRLRGKCGKCFMYLLYLKP